MGVYFILASFAYQYRHPSLSHDDLKSENNKIGFGLGFYPIQPLRMGSIKKMLITVSMAKMALWKSFSDR